MTTAVERDTSNDESGQSILEFLLLFPVMVAFILMAVKVSTVIQMSIVDQKYARSQALFLTYNSPVYPRGADRFRNILKTNQFVVGVADQQFVEQTGPQTPTASTYNIDRKRQKGNDEPGEVNKRNMIRVRNTVTLCTQSNVVKAGDLKDMNLALLDGSIKSFYFCGGKYHEQ